MTTRGAILKFSVAAGLCLAGVAQAGAPVGSWYLSPEALWLSPDSKLDAKEDTGYRIGIGRSLTQNWDVELGYSDTKHSPKNGSTAGDLKLKYTELDFKRVFNRDQRCNPFIDLGIGSINSKYDNVPGSDTSDLAGKVGVGALVALGQSANARIQLLMDAGVRLDQVKQHSSPVDPYVGLGLRFNVGGNTAVAAPAMAMAAPPPPPAAAPPPPAPVVAPPPPPAPPADTDGDGVPDNMDRCPNTPAGDKVDAVGCGLSVALQVNFDTNSANIKADSYGELDRFVEFLKAVPSAHGELEGHTDSVGSDAYNLRLSQQRAESVKAYAVNKGINAGRLNAKGYGETQPVADNKTADGRAQNRRVLFVRESLQQ